MSSPEGGNRHWSEIGGNTPRPMQAPVPRSPVDRPGKRGPRRARAGRRSRVPFLVVLGVAVIGGAAYFALDYTGVLFGEDADTGVSEGLQQATSQIAQEEAAAGKAEAEAALTERVLAWNALVESIAATGEDKTAELATFMQGSAEQVSQQADDYQARWAAGGADQTDAMVVPGSMTVAKVVLNPEHSLGGVLVTEEIQLADGANVSRVENMTWSSNEGTWRLANWTGAYWYVRSGRLPIEHGVQLDGVVWSVTRVQENPPAASAGSTDMVVTVTFAVGNQDTMRRVPADYSLCLWTPEDVRHDVSPLTDALAPGVREQMRDPMLKDEERTFSLAFEVPAGTDLGTLEFEVVGGSVNSPGSPGSPGSPDPSRIDYGTPRSWALATSALLAHVNGMRDDSLPGVSVTASHAQTQQEALARGWGVNNRDDLLAALEALDTGGHRAAWDVMAAEIVPMSETQFQQLLTQAANDPDMQHRFELVRQYASKFGSKSLMGFDYSRYVCLCRWGYLAGYLDEDEAWKLLMPAAAKLQGTFLSWKELGENYLIGREFWLYSEAQKAGDEMRSIYEELLSSSVSPWTLNPWDMDLGFVADGTV